MPTAAQLRAHLRDLYYDPEVEGIKWSLIVSFLPKLGHTWDHYFDSTGRIVFRIQRPPMTLAAKRRLQRQLRLWFCRVARLTLDSTAPSPDHFRVRIFTA